MDCFQVVINDLSRQEEVDAIVLGGSRALGKNDAGSDYDVYVYLNRPLKAEKRRGILETACSYLEIGNSYWELEDDCILKGGTVIELIYRNLKDVDDGLRRTLVECQAATGYTTCFAYNVKTGKVLYDPLGRYAALIDKYSFPYPDGLYEAIIRKNRELLDGKIPVML